MAAILPRKLPRQLNFMHTVRTYSFFMCRRYRRAAEFQNGGCDDEFFTKVDKSVV